MSETKTAFAYPRLCFAYFLEFAIWGSWAGALGGYAEVLELKGSQIGWLYAAIPLGAVISPLFIGPIADRYFSAQKVVSLLHLIGGLCLGACGVLCMNEQGTFPLLMTLILLSGICFMPTIALINSIVFKHSKEGNAPYVFVFGTIGWIVVNLFIAAFLGGAEKPYFFFAGGGASLLLAVYALTLPDTPPKGAPAPGEKSDALGLGALALFKDASFTVFIVCAFLASIPACNFFFPFQVPYLSQHGYPSPVALTTLNQFSELFFMSLLPFFILRFGLKWVLALGILAWSVRYFVFMVPTFECAIIGLLLHGFCYSFLYVAAYTYANKKAPDELKASAQSLMTFLLLGVGQVLGSQYYGLLRDLDSNKPEIASVIVEGRKDAAPLPPWNDTKAGETAWKYLDLAGTVETLRGIKKEGVQHDLGLDIDTNKDNIITAEELTNAKDVLTYGKENDKVNYSRADLEKLFRKIVKAEDANVPFKEISRTQYFAAQSANWKGILMPPAIFIGIIFLIFAVFGRNPDSKEETPEEAKPQEEN